MLFIFFSLILSVLWAAAFGTKYYVNDNNLKSNIYAYVALFLSGITFVFYRLFSVKEELIHFIKSLESINNSSEINIINSLVTNNDYISLFGAIALVTIIFALIDFIWQPKGE